MANSGNSLGSTSMLKVYLFFLAIAGFTGALASLGNAAICTSFSVCSAAFFV